MTTTGDYDEAFAYFKKIGMADNYQERMEEYAEDKAKREKEWEDDFMQYERAGLSEEDRKTIPELDETNNDSYRYLRERGNMWEYDPNKVHQKVKNRLYRRFDRYDKDADEVMTMSEVLYWADRMQPLCGSREEEIEKIRDSLRVFFRARGLTEEGLHRANWVEATQAFAEAEKERKKNGEESDVALLFNAYHDILDEDEDGLVSLPELKRMMNIFRVPEEAAYTIFLMGDIRKNGKLEREEFHELYNKFWLEEYDPAYDGLYAYKF